MWCDAKCDVVQCQMRCGVMLNVTLCNDRCDVVMRCDAKCDVVQCQMRCGDAMWCDAMW